MNFFFWTQMNTVCNSLMLVNSGHLLLSIGIRRSGFRCQEDERKS
jgi:hypothetical protein